MVKVDKTVVYIDTFILICFTDFLFTFFKALDRTYSSRSNNFRSQYGQIRRFADGSSWNPACGGGGGGGEGSYGEGFG